MLIRIRLGTLIAMHCLALAWGVCRASQSPTPQASPQSTPTGVIYPPLPFSLSGTGTRNTQIFSIDTAWTIEWSFDCSPYLRVGMFELNIYDGGGVFKQRVVRTIRAASYARMIYPHSGKYYLQIETECDWTVRVAAT